jgi:hypothetical protein
MPPKHSWDWLDTTKLLKSLADKSRSASRCSTCTLESRACNAAAVHAQHAACSRASCVLQLAKTAVCPTHVALIALARTKLNPVQARATQQAQRCACWCTAVGHRLVYCQVENRASTAFLSATSCPDHDNHVLLGRAVPPAAARTSWGACSSRSPDCHSHVYVPCNSVTCYFCRLSKNISQDQLEGLQQAASFLRGCSQAPDSDEHLRPTVWAMQAAMHALHRLQACLGAPGPVAFHLVRQVRGSMLLLEAAAALMGQPASSKFANLVRRDSHARDVLVKGAWCGCAVLR